MNLPQPILLADLAEVLKNAIPVIFVILYGIAHLVGMMQEKKKPAPRPRPRPAPPPPELQVGQPAAGRPVPPGNLEDKLRREVEEFLRRAQGGQPQAPEKRQPERAPQRPQPTRPQSTPRTQRPAERATPERTPRRLTETARVEPTSAPLEPLRPSPGAPSTGPGAPQRVGEPLRTQAGQHAQQVSQHAHSLGAEVAMADERMEQHLREQFVHQRGALAPEATTAQRARAAAAAMSPAVDQLRELLARPGGMRQLIIANEILRRPEERWDQ